jgi:hypothetical protein
MNFTKSTVQIGSLFADVFVSDKTNDYFYSLTSTADLIGKTPDSALRFLKSKAFKAIWGDAFQPCTFTEKNQTYKLLPCKVVSAYLMYWCTKGNENAAQVVSALMQESLELRAAKVFGQLTVEKVEVIQEKTNEYLATKARKEAKDEHCAFQRSCWQLGFVPSTVHDYLTKLVFSYSAKEARELPEVNYEDSIWEDLEIGINHHEEPILMELYRAIKRRFISYRRGTYKDRINRAYMELTEDIQLG